MKIQCELEQVTQLKKKGKAVFTFDKKFAGLFTEFSDKPLTIEVLVDTPEQAQRLSQISGDQRKKIYALFRDIGSFIGDTPDNMKENLKALYCYEKQVEHFSLGDCEREQASDFIEWLINWSFQNGVELKEQPKDLVDDIDRYIAICIQNRVCVVCGKTGSDIHHIQAIGAGRDRRKVDDSKHEKTCLCRKHHSEAHTIGWDTFKVKYHL